MEAAQVAPTLYKCQRCGWQSPVEAAYAIRKRANGSLVRCLCLECESKRNLNSTLLSYVLVPISGLLLLLINPNSFLGTMFLFIFAGLMVSIPLIVLHELSHALVAGALGFRVFAIHLGMGKVLFSGRFFGIAWIVRLIPSSGATLVSGPEMYNYRARIFLIHLAGPLFHILLNGLLVWLNRAFGLGGSFYTILVWTNLILLFTNLFPHKAQAAVGSVGSDGWAMLNAPRLPAQELQNRYASYYIYEAANAVETGDLPSALVYAEKGLSLYPENANMRNALGYVYVNSQEYEKSRQIFLQALGSGEELPFATKAILLNNVAFANLMLDNPELLAEADAFSGQAYQLLPWEPAISGTRGGVLIALDQPDEGLKLLKNAFDKNHDKRGKAIQACLLAWGEWKRGNPEKTQSYLALARQLDPGCYALERIQEKMHTGS